VAAAAGPRGQAARVPSARAQRIAVFVIAGPSGVGKSTIVARLRQTQPDLWWSVSVTTRAPRPGEEHGVDYLFTGDAAFDDLVAGGELLEWALIYGHRSG